ncbi:hypothetical protein L209DRAFT_345819 [Thermothelomyces heterothallicus CBS 203.75]
MAQLKSVTQRGVECLPDRSSEMQQHKTNIGLPLLEVESTEYMSPRGERKKKKRRPRPKPVWPRSNGLSHKTSSPVVECEVDKGLERECLHHGQSIMALYGRFVCNNLQDAYYYTDDHAGHTRNPDILSVPQERCAKTPRSPTFTPDRWRQTKSEKSPQEPGPHVISKPIPAIRFSIARYWIVATADRS